MIIGAHTIIYSRNPEADRAFLRDMLKFPSVDVGDGWLIFGLPPAEVALHPSEDNDVHKFYLMCDDIQTLTATMRQHGIAHDPVENQGWGLLTQITLPGGGKLGIYEPRHARPKPMGAAGKSRKVASRGSRKPTRKTTRKSTLKSTRKTGTAKGVGRRSRRR